MYPRASLVAVEVGGLIDHLCGPFRPGHFTGVATVVLALFHIVQPDRAYFGEKDRQQLAVVQRMVDELHVPVTVVPIPTLREHDGLAMSSRNVHLTPEERVLAPLLYQALRDAADQIARGATESRAIVAEAVARIPASELLRLEYFSIVDARELQSVDRIAGPVVVAGALWVGGTRLIDNLLCETALNS
jgi:pantoate--beta-alanine ligase